MQGRILYQSGDEILYTADIDENELLYKLKGKKEHDNVCLIPNGAELNKNFYSIIEDYKEEREEQIAYLPLVVLQSGKMTGILNSCLWNNNLAAEPGVLTHDLALMQIDLSLYGAMIPSKLFYDETNYKQDLKYYQHFYFLNKVTKDENNVTFGIPKILLFTGIDLSLPNVSNEEKLQHFKLAKEI